MLVEYTPDGLILFVFRPFDITFDIQHTNHNDATILEDCFNRYENKMNTIHEDDIWRHHFDW